MIILAVNGELYPRASIFEVIYNWAEPVIRSHVANNVNSAKLIYIATDGCRNINIASGIWPINSLCKLFADVRRIGV